MFPFCEHGYHRPYAVDNFHLNIIVVVVVIFLIIISSMTSLKLVKKLFPKKFQYFVVKKLHYLMQRD